jgi:hypothetical protein
METNLWISKCNIPRFASVSAVGLWSISGGIIFSFLNNDNNSNTNAFQSDLCN